MSVKAAFETKTVDGLIVSTGPSTEVVTTSEAKSHLRIDHADEDSYIDDLIQAAREYCEEATATTFINTTYTLTLDDFPQGGRAIRMPRSPVSSVTSITYLDGDGDSQTLSSSVYLLDSKSWVSRIVPVNTTTTWPEVQDRINTVTIIFVAGYGATAASVPMVAKQAMLLLIGHWYENREAVLTGAVGNPVAMSVASLLSKISRREFV